MIESMIGAGRYLRAMVAAMGRPECLGLILLAVPPGELDAAPDWDALLGPYLGLVRPVAAGCEGGGVALPEGVRVLAEGLETRCWPGSETAFREELASPAPVRGEPSPPTGDGPIGVGGRALAEIAWYLGVGPAAVPAAIVLDPATRRVVVVSLPSHASTPDLFRKLVDEMSGWPRRRLAVVETLLTARVEHAALERPLDPEIQRIQGYFARSLGCTDDHARATLLARCFDELRTAESAQHGRPRDDDGPGRRERLRATVAALRDELERGDRSCSTADAAVRAAHAEFGALRTAASPPPDDRLAGWRFDRFWTSGPLSRAARGLA